MKKTISVIVALVMMFVMCIPAFAEGEDLVPVKPTDPAELGVYYAELLNAEDSDPVAVANEMLNDLITGEEGDEGVYTVEDLPVVLTAFAENSNDVDKLAAVAEQIEAGLADMGIVLPDMDDVIPPPAGEENEESSTLPEDEEPTDDTGFLNTILGILGSIGDMIFGGGDSGDSGDNSGDNGDDAWGDGDADTGTDDDDLVPDTGDTTVISVAAVALVAGAALVLTRKKSEDAE